MVSVLEYKKYLEGLKDFIPEITVAKLVMDNEQLALFLGDHSYTKKYFLAGLVPGHGVKGSQDFAKGENFSSLLILHKTVEGVKNHDAFLEKIDEAQVVCRRLVHKLLLDSTECTIMSRLTKLSPQPLYGLFGCDGYEIEIEFGSDV